MKTSFIAVLLTLTFSTNSFSSEGLVLSVKTHEVMTLKKISKTKFEKISQVATGNASLSYVTPNATKNIMSNEINEAETQNMISLEVAGKNILRVIDEKESINTEVPAQVSTSLLGSVKKIKVDAKILQGLYAESMKKSGMDIYMSLNLFGGAVTSTITTSDMNCEADGELLICQQDAALLMNIR